MPKVYCKKSVVKTSVLCINSLVKNLQLYDLNKKCRILVRVITDLIRLF